jgi:hypothetical protein
MFICLYVYSKLCQSRNRINFEQNFRVHNGDFCENKTSEDDVTPIKYFVNWYFFEFQKTNFFFPKNAHVHRIEFPQLKPCYLLEILQLDCIISCL